MGLEENREWIVGVEDVLTGGGPKVSEPCFHCFLDPRLAPGYLAWVVCDGEETHVGVGGYAERFDPARALEEFRAEVSRTRGILPENEERNLPGWFLPFSHEQQRHPGRVHRRAQRGDSAGKGSSKVNPAARKRG